MVNRRCPLAGLFAVLLALMAQLGAGASVPAMDPVSGVTALCHTDDGAPSQAPGHPADCPACPLCAALHAPPVLLASVAGIAAPSGGWAVIKAGLPPPSTAPPASHRPPSQPRAPPPAR